MSDNAVLQRLRPYFAEYVGMAFFVYMGATGASTNGGSILAIATAFGIGLAVSIYVAGPVSGGHLNPAVTLSMVATGNLSPIDGAAYIVSQLAGSITGCAVGYGILGSDGFGGSLAVQPGVNAGQAFVAEIVGTFLLVSVVFNTAVQTTVGLQTPSKLNVRANAPFIIGMSMWAMQIVMIGIDGCGINPARAFGTAVINNDWDDHWVYWAGPIVGVLCAVATQYILFGGATAEDVKEEDEVNPNTKVTDARVVV